MKKIISLILSSVLVFTALPVLAQNTSNFLVNPMVQTFDSFTFMSNAMRIVDQSAGYRYVIEFNINMPPSVGKNTAYSMDFNHNTMDTGAAGVSHNSLMTVSDDKWNWTAAGKTVADNLECGTDYKIEIAVDLKEQKQYCSVSKASDGTVLEYLQGEPIHQAILSDEELRITHHFRWGGAWVDKTNETWGPVRPSNVKLSRNISYALQPPTVTIEDGTVSASVMTYHNTSEQTKSPMLLVCVYDRWGMLVDSMAAQADYEENTTLKPVAKELSVSKEIKLSEGMKVLATVLGGFSARLPYASAVEVVYSE